MQRIRKLRGFSVDDKAESPIKKEINSPIELLDDLNDLIVTYTEDDQYENCLNLVKKSKGK